ncbi:hypothetical protein N7451_002734 [Penicillium sp. IBT 35674x]|nr:hypothetical protein N7451_002734 [Penicillium sp. IBT 35674x]
MSTIPFHDDIQSGLRALSTEVFNDGIVLMHSLQLRKGLDHVYTFNSPITERQHRRHSSTTSSASSTSLHQQPWLNEQVLRIFDEPSVPEMFPQAQSEQELYNTLTPDIYSNTFQPSPDKVFDEMLQNLEAEIETEYPEGDMLNAFHDTAVEHCPNLACEPDILSPQARALLHYFPELDRSNTAAGDQWRCAPAYVSGDSMVPHVPFSPSSVPAPPAPSPSNPSGPLRDSGMDYLPRFPDPFFSLGSDCLQNISAGKQSLPCPRPTQQTDAFSHSVSRNRPYRKFQFVLEDIGGKAPIIMQ